jgi:hypothetical protein
LEFLDPTLTIQGTSQGRPPIRVQFQYGAPPTVFDFLTWHAEHRLSLDNVMAVYERLESQGGNRIIAGDLNIRDGGVEAVLQNHILTQMPNIVAAVVFNP